MLPFALEKLIFYAYKKGMMKMFGCVFCQIADHKEPAAIVYEDEHCLALRDFNPKAPVHLLVIPRKHLPSLKEAQAGDEALLGHLILLAAQLARERGLESKGYRTLINNGTWAGQSVFHLHVHVLGGRAFHWPPG